MNYIKSEVLSQFLIFIRAWPTLLGIQVREKEDIDGHTSTKLCYNFYFFIETKKSYLYFKESKFYFYEILLNHSQRS